MNQQGRRSSSPRRRSQPTTSPVRGSTPPAFSVVFHLFLRFNYFFGRFQTIDFVCFEPTGNKETTATATPGDIAIAGTFPKEFVFISDLFIQIIYSPEYVVIYFISFTEYNKNYERLLPHKDSLITPGRPSKDLAALRDDATKAWSNLLNLGVDVSVLHQPFWSIKKVCDIFPVVNYL